MVLSKRGQSTGTGVPSSVSPSASPGGLRLRHKHPRAQRYRRFLLVTLWVGCRCCCRAWLTRGASHPHGGACAGAGGAGRGPGVGGPSFLPRWRTPQGEEDAQGPVCRILILKPSPRSEGLHRLPPCCGECTALFHRPRVEGLPLCKTSLPTWLEEAEFTWQTRW